MLSLCFTAYLRKSSLHSLSFLYNISQPNAVSPWSPIWHRKLTMLTLFPFPKLIFSSASYFNWPHFGIWLWPLPLAWRFNLYLVSLCISSDWLTVPSSSFLLIPLKCQKYYPSYCLCLPLLPTLHDLQVTSSLPMILLNFSALETPRCSLLT